ncbi:MULTISPECIES: hydroxyethylthiazole kinase [Staphylococcus]|uniref:Hydroxyethylthiazole kinase n=1 Tax=Staphylococcus hsinchuensis TaxID=3051183 RepID=A0ABZ3ECM4_9STAP|nr:MULTISPECIES: hydroxyethylthiazole kinase [unclassified Staphylococcus]
MTNNLEQLRTQNPLVICYTNDVVKNFTANGLLSLGASPAMSEAPEEAEDMLQVAQTLLINIGTLTKDQEMDIIKIGQTANKVGTPIVFDPVAVGASQYRKDFCKRFLEEVEVSVVKGNSSEVLTLIDSETKMKGTEGDHSLDVVNIAKSAHEQLKCAIIITGKTDVIAHNGQIVKLNNGSPLLAKVTGAGCLLGAVVASFVDQTQLSQLSINALIEAVSIYNIAAEQADNISQNKGPGTFAVELINYLSLITYDDYLTHHQVQEV